MLFKVKVKRPKSATLSVPAMNIIGTALRLLLGLSLYLRKSLIIIGEVANYHVWLEEEFGNVKLRNSRERVWKDIDFKVSRKSIHVIELGVAWGYLTNFCITKYKTRILKWDAYDTFTGLPRAWRGLPVGAFGTNGETPNILDERISWHVGPVEETIQSLEISSNRNYSLVVFFDLDIYEPSLAAWLKLKPMLIEGDILYFDEAFDFDERGLIVNQILPSGDFEFVSANWTSLALRLKVLHD